MGTGLPVWYGRVLYGVGLMGKVFQQQYLLMRALAVILLFIKYHNNQGMLHAVESAADVVREDILEWLSEADPT